MSRVPRMAALVRTEGFQQAHDPAPPPTINSFLDVGQGRRDVLASELPLAGMRDCDPPPKKVSQSTNTP